MTRVRQFVTKALHYLRGDEITPKLKEYESYIPRCHSAFVDENGVSKPTGMTMRGGVAVGVWFRDIVSVPNEFSRHLYCMLTGGGLFEFLPLRWVGIGACPMGSCCRRRLRNSEVAEVVVVDRYSLSLCLQLDEDAIVEILRCLLDLCCREHGSP